MWNVDFLVQNEGITEGAQLTNLITLEVKRIMKEDFSKLADLKFYNAEYMGGILAGKRNSGGLKIRTVEELRAEDASKSRIAPVAYTGDKTIKWTHTFMCMDTEVARLAVGVAEILRVEFLKPEYLPAGIEQTEASIMSWLSRRRIPASRAHLKRMEWVIGSIDGAVFKSLGLSLSDSFWLKPVNSEQKWSDVNFFNNIFTDDVGDYLMTEAMGGVDLNSPSINTEGMVPKKWTIMDGKRQLVKGTLGTNFWQYNEVAAFRIGKALGLPVLPYGLCEKNTCCYCPCMIQSGQNLVTADDILRDRLGAHLSTESGWYDNEPQFYQILCEEFGREYIDGIILFDYIIRNRDRHTRNIAKIQNAATHKYIKNAPIYDNGSSLMESYDPLDRNFHKSIGTRIKSASRPFYTPHEIQVKLVDKTPFMAKLRDCAKAGAAGNIIREVYKTSRIDKEVINALANYINGLVVGLTDTF